MNKADYLSFIINELWKYLWFPIVVVLTLLIVRKIQSPQKNILNRSRHTKYVLIAAGLFLISILFDREFDPLIIAILTIALIIYAVLKIPYYYKEGGIISVLVFLAIIAVFVLGLLMLFTGAAAYVGLGRLSDY